MSKLLGVLSALTVMSSVATASAQTYQYRRIGHIEGHLTASPTFVEYKTPVSWDGSPYVVGECPEVFELVSSAGGGTSLAIVIVDCHAAVELGTPLTGPAPFILKSLWLFFEGNGVLLQTPSLSVAADYSFKGSRLNGGSGQAMVGYVEDREHQVVVDGRFRVTSQAGERQDLYNEGTNVYLQPDGTYVFRNRKRYRDHENKPEFEQRELWMIEVQKAQP